MSLDDIGDTFGVGRQRARRPRRSDDGLAQQIVLRSEAAVDGARGEPGLANDVADARALVALLGEHPTARRRATAVLISSSSTSVTGLPSCRPPPPCGE